MAIIEAMDIIYILVVLGVILISMTLHELMHALVAYKLGDQTPKAQGRISLNPIRHIDPFLTILMPMMIVISNMLTGANLPIFGGAKPVQLNPLKIKYNEWGMALVAFVGPAINFVIAFIAFGLLVVFKDAGDAMRSVLMLFVQVNLGFFVFNMLPIPPLDGSRVLYALAPEFVRKGMDAIERSGLLVIFIVVMLLSSVIGTFLGAIIRAILQFFALVFGVSIQ